MTYNHSFSFDNSLKYKNTMKLAIILGLAALFCMSYTEAAVYNASGYSYATIQEAINDVNFGTELNVTAGTYNEDLVINRAVNIFSNNSTKGSFL